jgi:hypothetical protein
MVMVPIDFMYPFAESASCTVPKILKRKRPETRTECMNIKD